MKEFFVTALYVAIPVSLFGMAAYLIHAKAEGWGWFLFAVVLIVGSMKWEV